MGNEKEKEKDTYNTQRVHLVNILMIIIVASLMAGQSVMTRGFAGSVRIFLEAGAVIAISLINFFLPINKYVKGYIFGFIAGATTLALIILNDFSLDNNYILFTSIAMVSLYFKKELILIHSIIMDAGLVIVYILAPASVMGSNSASENIASVIIMLIGAEALLYFLTWWGRNSVRESSESFEMLNKTFGDIRESTEFIDGNIINLNDNIDDISMQSKNIITTMQEMTAAVQQQADSVNDVNRTMAESMKLVKVKETASR
jgi:methyl-accepting chemotaxis protein